MSEQQPASITTPTAAANSGGLRSRSRSRSQPRDAQHVDDELASARNPFDVEMVTTAGGLPSAAAAFSAAACPRGTEVEGMRYVLSLLLDFLLYAAVCVPRLARWTRPDYTVVHFVLVPVFTDVLCLGVPSRFHHIVAWFRIATAVQLGSLQLMLWRMDFDDSVVTLLLGLAASAAVSLDALHVIVLQTRLSSFSRKTWNAVIDLLILDRGGAVAAFIDVVNSLAFAMAANVFCNTHNLWGDARLDGPLTGFQAADAFSSLLKVVFLEALVPSRRHRFVTSALFFMSLAVQWPFMWQMYSEARWPFLHAGAELSLLLKSVRYFQSWVSSNR